ncbi:MAG: hypothetical protein HY716_09190 [Planctomycetes bacterium]|nr:hypothetical protein [Planctomycetota bacterium]
MAAGLQVPSFLCLTTEAFRAHLATLPPEPTPRQVKDAQMPESVRDSLSEAFKMLGSKPLAVRSSATTEDHPVHSFAGQYVTLLGVRDLAALERAVKACWASLRAEDAITYRAKAGLNGANVAMGVVLQVHMAADATGVLFTAEPMTRRRDRVIVESAHGAGETVVSGRLAPERHVFSSPGLRLLSGSRGFSKQARRLALLARRAETRLGGPLDIEWARSGKDIYFLQARPMTGHIVPTEDLQVWSNINTAEVLPQVLTPCSWSLIRQLQHRMFRLIFKEFGQDIERTPVVGLVGGRIYFNLSVAAGLLRAIPLITPEQINALLGGVRSELPEGGIPQFKAPPLRLVTRFLKVLLSIAAATPSRIERFRRSYRAQTLQFERQNPRTMDLAELRSFFRNVARHLLSEGRVIFMVAAAIGWFERLRRFTKVHLGDEGEILAQQLVAGAGGMESADAGLELWGLADGLRGEPEVIDAVRESEDPADWRRLLQGKPSGVKFLQNWERFLERHGHRAVLELELAEPRWRESPVLLARSFREYVNSHEEMDPVGRRQRSALAREELLGACFSRLNGPLLRGWFRLLVRWAAAGLRLRENIKSSAMVQFAALRRVLLELGHRFAKRGLIDTANDIFYLTFDEVETLDRDSRAMVRERRQEHDCHARMQPPPVVVGRWEPAAEKSPGEAHGRILQGIGIYPGLVTATARVLLDACDRETLRPGEILVAPFTNSGWAPVMLTAAALVVDTGGLLSHGSILAREYGIPTVVNVGSATRVIRTGQRLHVDGARGSVKILD